MESSLEFSGSLSRSRTFKVLLIGDSGVGKTCLTHRLSAAEFPRRAEATIGVDFRERTVDVDGEKIKLQLWDTAGQERFRKSMVQHYYRNVHAVLFIYDVSSPASFNGLSCWVEECRQHSLGHDIPRFLIGNKSDLRSQSRRDLQVSQERALSFARANNLMFFETSAMFPPERRSEGRRRELQEDEVEDIVSALGKKLKRQRNTGNVLACSGSFKVSYRRTPEKEVWTCC
ncbi:ras-related protein Rab-33B-like [Gouania willdenowi]|uniref:Ras-related protein Rab-33B-like n=1 Tax=Gouania willdenowi TaxID=441366 RepID=A0A8C5HJI4_GOUWI|nr:ras-related protein Rab-33B-like [Gouania willdenowi]